MNRFWEQSPEELRRSGIYIIENLLDGKRYVGSSVNLYNRFRNHLQELRANKHDCPKLQAAWNKYGSESFVFKPLFYCPSAQLFKQEDLLLKSDRFHTHYYNVSRDAFAARRGVKLTPEQCAAMSSRQKGRKLSEEAKAKLSAALKGRRHTREHVARASMARIGARRSEETCRRIGESKRGMVHSEESRCKRSEKMTGRKFGPRTSEARRKMAIAKLGKKNPLKWCPVESVDPASGLVVEYESVASAEVAVPKAKGHIGEVCRGNRSIAGGLMWRFLNTNLIPG